MNQLWWKLLTNRRTNELTQAKFYDLSGEIGSSKISYHWNIDITVFFERNLRRNFQYLPNSCARLRYIRFQGVMWLNLINGWNPVVEGFALATPQPTLCPDFRDVYLFYPYSRTATTHDNRQLLESKTYKKCDNCELRKHSSYIPYFNAKIWTSEKRLN